MCVVRIVLLTSRISELILVFVDKNMTAKLSDFTLAKLIPANMTHVSKNTAFTTFECRGYLTPEYALRGQLTRRADIYSFAIFGSFFSPIMTSRDIQPCLHSIPA
ncbi:hypothetical protein RND81_01G074500 [Saponaria officinalis]|uniref:Serine-threonine/tyrosine-protein kinase catalytic domain-containing protein n=1 Tax=Saponaria officinalis TaxID=3572 RepID=A0AAW1NCH7_SAPOF